MTDPPDPNARMQKFIHYMTIATFAIADLCDSGLSPFTQVYNNKITITAYSVQDSKE